MFAALPSQAARRHVDTRTGYEVAWFDGFRSTGGSSLVVDDAAVVVRYRIEVAPDWTTRAAVIEIRSAAGDPALLVETDGQGRWQVDGAPRPDLDGCLDVDLEASSMTNTFPVHRLALAVGASAQAPAAWVRTDGTVERLEQTYRRLADDAGGPRFVYAAPALDFTSLLRYDRSGLVVDYPGIAVRDR